MSLFYRLPKWAKMLPAPIRPYTNKIRALEVIRHHYSVDHKMFYLHIICHPETTRKLQRYLYTKFKKKYHNAPEEDILFKLIYTRWSADGGELLFNLDQYSNDPMMLKEKILEIARDNNSLRKLTDAIILFEEENYTPTAIPTSPELQEAAERVSYILANTNEAGAPEGTPGK